MRWQAIFMLICATALLASCKTTQSQSGDMAENDIPAPRPKSEIAKINVQLGMAYLQEKNVQRAKQKFLLALDQGPDIPESWYSMGYFHEVTGNKTEANRYYQRAVQIAPKRGDAQNNYGTFLCRSGRYQESISHFMMAVNSPDYLDPAAAYENAGLCSMKMKAYNQAASYFKQALLKDPARSFSLFNLAQAQLKLKNFHEADETLTQYALVSPPTDEYYVLRKEIDGHLPKKTG